MRSSRGPRPNLFDPPTPQAIVKLGEGFNGADMRNICTEAGLFAIRAERDYVVQEDFMKVRPALGPSAPCRAGTARAGVRLVGRPRQHGWGGGEGSVRRRCAPRRPSALCLALPTRSYLAVRQVLN